MKKLLLLLFMFTVLFGCNSKKRESSIINRYIVDVTLINNEHKIDTFYLESGTVLDISANDGTYMLIAKTSPSHNLFKYAPLKYACIDFKIKEISYHRTDIIERNSLGFARIIKGEK